MNPCDACERTGRHATLRASFEAWDAGTTPWARADGLVYANCVDCRSTLTLPECAGCGVTCPTGDAVETRRGTFHVRCLLLRGRFTVVAQVRVGRAEELR